MIVTKEITIIPAAICPRRSAASLDGVGREQQHQRQRPRGLGLTYAPVPEDLKIMGSSLHCLGYRIVHADVCSVVLSTTTIIDMPAVSPYFPFAPFNNEESMHAISMGC